MNRYPSILGASLLALLLGSLLGLASATPSQAASFDCRLARTLVETTICTDPSLSAVDDALADAYAARMANAKAPAAVRDRQRAWMARRDTCRTPGCLQDAYDRRLMELGAGRQGTKFGPDDD